MREIKFRLILNNKIVGYEKWYGGNFGEVLSAKPCWLYSKDNKFWNPDYIYHKQKNQYTELEDKNGKEIYERDVVKDERGTILEVKYDKDGYGLKDGQYWVAFNSWEFLEVIGNIDENSELVKEEKE